MNQLVSSYSADPGLGIGMAYMVPREPYETYLLERLDDDEVRYSFFHPAIPTHPRT